MIDLSKEGDVFVLHMKDGENRYNRPFLEALNAALDEVEASSGPAALVTTGAGKFYSNGLDLAWLMGDGAGEMKGFIEDVHALFARILTFPMYTVAAVNGHAFAGGAMLMMAHDYKVMRSDRGYFCLPEVDLKMPTTPAMNALIAARLSRVAAHEALVTGKRYDAQTALARDIADDIAPEAEVLPRAIAAAAEYAKKDRKTIGALKRGLHAEALKVMMAKG
ncbi:MAG: enoyl-CoA hydratase/isomerase family protein [Chrysiogenetes bacterium]|nr:enoyl-CoA hydratase/isomerase family protein [Chrysiogenetes bacterium]